MRTSVLAMTVFVTATLSGSAFAMGGSKPKSTGFLTSRGTAFSALNRVNCDLLLPAHSGVMNEAQVQTVIAKGYVISRMDIKDVTPETSVLAMWRSGVGSRNVNGSQTNTTTYSLANGRGSAVAEDIISTDDAAKALEAAVADLPPCSKQQ